METGLYLLLTCNGEQDPMCSSSKKNPHLGNFKWIFCGGDLQKCLPQLVVSAVGLLETNAWREVCFITY